MVMVTQPFAYFSSKCMDSIHYKWNILNLKQVNSLKEVGLYHSYTFTCIEKFPNILHLLKGHFTVVDFLDRAWLYYIDKAKKSNMINVIKVR